MDEQGNRTHPVKGQGQERARRKKPGPASSSMLAVSQPDATAITDGTNSCEFARRWI